MIVLLEDSRQQEGKHQYKRRYFEEHGIKVERTKLYVGDYTLPTNQSVCIDTKKDLQEVVMDICGAEHERFRDECIRAKEAGIKLYILIEEDQTDESGHYVVNSLSDVHRWQNPRRNIRVKKDGKWVQKYPKATTGGVLKKAMITMMYRYGCEFVFCRKKDAGKKILELLGVEDGREDIT